jgi:hypothetical protein
MAALRFPERTIDAAKTASEFARIHNDQRLKKEVQADITAICEGAEDVMAVVPFHSSLNGQLMYEVSLLTGGAFIVPADEVLL